MTKDNQQEVCPACESKTAARTVESRAFTYGSGNESVELSAVVSVLTCDSCEMEFTEAAAEELRHEAVCRHLNQGSSK